MNHNFSKMLTAGFVLLLMLGGCTWPRDPMGTTEAVRNNVMFVGVSENPPWVTRTQDKPGGIEVELVQAFARQMNAEIEWKWGSLTEHLEALHQYELHLAIGGLTQSSPGSSEVGVTQPFYETKIVVGVHSGLAAPTQLAEISVGVIRGTAVADYVRQADAEVVYLSDEKQINLPTAVPHWQLDDLDLESSGPTLHTLHHVMAVPPGENQWLTELETFLNKQPPMNP